LKFLGLALAIRNREKPAVKASAFLASLFFCMFKYRFFLICIRLAMYPTVAYSAKRSSKKMSTNVGHVIVTSPLEKKPNFAMG
jgi:hypothetical protein